MADTAKSESTCPTRCQKPREALMGDPPRVVLLEIRCGRWIRCEIHGGCIICGWTGTINTSWGAVMPCSCMEGLG